MRGVIIHDSSLNKAQVAKFKLGMQAKGVEDVRIGSNGLYGSEFGVILLPKLAFREEFKNLNYDFLRSISELLSTFEEMPIFIGYIPQDQSIGFYKVVVADGKISGVPDTRNSLDKFMKDYDNDDEDIEDIIDRNNSLIMAFEAIEYIDKLVEGKTARKLEQTDYVVAQTPNDIHWKSAVKEGSVIKEQIYEYDRNLLLKLK